MSFIGSVEQGKTYTPGYFLAHEECTRVTKEIAQNHAQVVTANGTKHVPMGAFYPANSSSTVIGIIYEDVDVTDGAMPGSVVTSGVVYLDRLPAAPESGVQAALEGKGFKFISSAPGAIRPEYPTEIKALTVAFAEASASGKTQPTVSGVTPRTGDKYLFKLGTGTSASDAPNVKAGDIPSGWDAWDGTSAITVASGDDGKYATIALVNAFGEAIAAGSGAVDRKS